MTTYSESNFDTKTYDLARPSYPDEFYETLYQYHTSSKDSTNDLAIDVGCGSGFVTFKLTKYFNKVIGTDISSTMIDKCNEIATNENKTSDISFNVSPAEKSPSNIEPNSVDLISGAECLHWVNHDIFFKECNRILKPGGTLSYWFYLDPVFIDSPIANEIYQNYAYGSKVENNYEHYMGPYYEQPGHEFYRTALKTVEVPERFFNNLIVNHYDPNVHGDEPNRTTLFIKKRLNLKLWKNYVKSWSAYHAWMKENGESHKDVADCFIDELIEKVGWNENDEIIVIFPTIYTFAKKI